MSMPLDPRLLFVMYRRWLIFAALPALLVFAGVYVKGTRAPKVYQSTAVLYIQQSSNPSDPNSDVYTAQAVIPTYTQMVTLPVMAQRVNTMMAKRWPGYNFGDHTLAVNGGGSVPGQALTQLMYLTVSDSVPARAMDAANDLAYALRDEVAQIQAQRFNGGEKAIKKQLDSTETNIQYVTQRISSYAGPATGLNGLKAQLSAYQGMYQSLLNSEEEFSVARNTAINGVKLFSPAGLPGPPVGSSPLRPALMDAILVFILGCGLIYLYGYFDDTIKTPEEIEDVAGARIIATVPKFDGPVNGLITSSDPRSGAADAYRVLRTNLQSLPEAGQMRVVLLTSSTPSEGKSTTISNLGHVMAEAGQRVTLIDADLRRPSLHRIFRQPPGDGLAGHLANLSAEPALQPTDHPHLKVLPGGRPPERPTDLLTSESMSELIPRLEESSDVVLVDSPPVLAAADAAVLSKLADAVVLVVDPGKSKRRELARARAAVEAVNGKLVGVVVNQISPRSTPYYYYYHQYYYSYSYSSYAYDGNRTSGSSGLPSKLRRKLLRNRSGRSRAS